MKTTNTRTLTECAMMLALAVGLSFICYEMPMGMGGSITPASMLPILLIGIKYPPKWSFGTAFVYSLFQLLQAVMKGTVFVYCETWVVVLCCVLLDYLLPFTLLGITAFAKKDHLSVYIFTVLAVFIRFGCHFLSGILIWGQWAENMSPAVYSLLYNGSFLLPELLICLAVMTPLLEVKVIRRLLGLNFNTALDKSN